MDFCEKFGICVIESLSERDLRTGEAILDGIIREKQASEPNLSAEYFQVRSKEEFIKVLTDLDDRIIPEQYQSILHIEAHGSEDGIQLSNGDLVTWEEFLDLIRPINIKRHNYLQVNLSVCEGHYIVTRINPSREAPFRCVVSTGNKISAADILEGFSAFYEYYFFSFDFIEAVNRCNATLAGKNKMNYITAEHCFDSICNPDRDPKEFRRSINALSVMYKAENPEYLNTPFQEVFEIVNQEVRQLLAETRENRNHFLMKEG